MRRVIYINNRQKDSRFCMIMTNRGFLRCILETSVSRPGAYCSINTAL